MKSALNCLVGMIASLSVSPLMAAPPEKTKLGGDVASIYIIGRAGCFDNFLSLTANDDSNGNVFTSKLTVFMSIVDTCNNDTIIRDITYFSDDSLPPADFVVSRPGTAASLATTVQAFDIATQQTVSVTFNIQWKPTSKATVTQNVEHVRSSSSFFGSRSTQSNASASFTGTVLIENEPTNILASDGLFSFGSIGTNATGIFFHSKE